MNWLKLIFKLFFSKQTASINSIDNIHRFTVNVSPLRFKSTTGVRERQEENETTEIPKFTQKSKGINLKIIIK